MAHRNSRNKMMTGLLRASGVAMLLGWLAVPGGAAAAGEEAELLAMVDSLSEMSVSIGDPGDSRRKQDRALRDSLTAAVEAFSEVEQRVVSLSEADAERWAVVGPLRLAQARAALAEHIRDSDVPSYLNADQRAVYRMALEDKGAVQLSAAEEAFELALDRATERGLEGSLVNEARAGLASVRSLQGG